MRNVIVRNLTFRDTRDCFPRWDPNDNSPDSPPGNWNSLYDSVSLQRSENVWVDHNTFTDEPNVDSTQPLYFGRPYQVHDGQLDITSGSDLVTVSRNVFTEHGKTMLIGSSNTSTTDPGKLRVSVHHNVFRNVQERAPRVRFGQVHVYNNLYEGAPGVQLGRRRPVPDLRAEQLRPRHRAREDRLQLGRHGDHRRRQPRRRQADQPGGRAQHREPGQGRSARTRAGRRR